MGNFTNTLNYAFVINKNPEVYITSTPTAKQKQEQETKEKIIEGLESLLEVWK